MQRVRKDSDGMKQHRFWALAMVFCLGMTLYTGYRHK